MLDIVIYCNLNQTTPFFRTRPLGNPEASKRRLAVLEKIMKLKVTNNVKILGNELLKSGALPIKAKIDAYHVAVATIHGIEYLLTWNCTHIANAHMRPKIESTCRAMGYESTLICTPDELTES